jgi:4-oxalocrotonate tautomerase
MPFINIKLIESGVTQAQKEALIKGVTQVMVDVLDKNPQSTHVVIDEINADNWGVGGELVSKRKI